MEERKEEEGERERSSSKEEVEGEDISLLTLYRRLGCLHHCTHQDGSKEEWQLVLAPVRGVCFGLSIPEEPQPGPFDEDGGPRTNDLGHRQQQQVQVFSKHSFRINTFFTFLSRG